MEKVRIRLGIGSGGLLLGVLLPKILAFWVALILTLVWIGGRLAELRGERIEK